jgi:hypothetical protein
VRDPSQLAVDGAALVPAARTAPSVRAATPSEGAAATAVATSPTEPPPAPAVPVQMTAPTAGAVTNAAPTAVAAGSGGVPSSQAIATREAPTGVQATAVPFRSDQDALPADGNSEPYILGGMVLLIAGVAGAAWYEVRRRAREATR